MDFEIVRKINGLAGRVRPVDLMLDLIARYGHWAFVIYGLMMWFLPGEDKKKRRECCILAFLGVCIASLISYGIGKIWKRERPFRQDSRIWNFTGHKANASFPSNHTMNSALVVMELIAYHVKGSKVMAVLATILAFSRLFSGVHYPSDLLGGLTIAGFVHWGLHHPYVMTFVKPLAALATWVSDAVISKIRGW